MSGTTTASTLQYTIPVTVAGMTYNIYVTATNDRGTSNSSSTLAIIAANSPSSMPAPFSVTATTTQITVGWTAPADTGFSAVIGYYLYWNAGGSGNIISTPIYDSASNTIFSYTITTGIIAGNTYSFAVSAYNSVSVSSISNII